MNPTLEQQSILDFATTESENLMITAFAGCGKTSTLEMIDGAVKKQPHLFLCFNKAIANEASKRMVSTTTVRTFNSLGHRIWANHCGSNLRLNTRKVPEIFRALVDEAKKAERAEMWNVYDQVIFGVNLARAHGYIPEGHTYAARSLISQTNFHQRLDESPDDLVSDLLDSVLSRCIAAATRGEIDFNDQVYMPALFDGNYPRFPLVLIDEYQDLSPINHAMLTKLCVSSRQIGVGDDCQAIYAFRGAKAGGMAEAITQYRMSELYLSISFRCPSAIVRNVHWRVPEFKSNREGGNVANPSVFNSIDLSDSASIICRNNAPLLRLAFGLLSSGRSVSVAGTDIGPWLVSTMRKLGPESLTQFQTLSIIDDWLADKLSRESKTAEDYAECMRVFARHGANLGQAIAYAEHLFKQDGTIKLMTGHKAKGLEFDHVYHLDSHLCKRGRGQDSNVAYVIDTRAKESLTYIKSDGITWN